METFQERYKELQEKAFEAIKRSPMASIQSAANSFTATVGDEAFIAQYVRGFSSFGLYMVVGVIEEGSIRRYISFAAGQENVDGLFLVGPEESAPVTAGYTIEEEGKPTREYPGDMGGAEIDNYTGAKPYSGRFITRLAGGEAYKVITDAAFNLDAFEIL